MSILTRNDKKSIFFVVPERNEGTVIQSTLEPLIGKVFRRGG